MDFVVRARSAAFALGIFLLIAACWAPVLAAAGLYTGTVPVNSQDEAERAAALKTALGQVILRVSGDSAALTQPGVAKAVAEAERYVQQFSYQQDVVTEGGAAPQIRLTLIAQFDRDAIDRLLRKHDLAQEEIPPPVEGQPAAEAAPNPNPGSYRVWIAGVRSPQDYARLIGALSGNEFVRDVQVELARGDGVQVRVATATSLSRLLDAWSAGAVIRVAKAKPPVEGLDALLDLQP